jgi:Na+-transporting NADH:ubiquinone oxidoreductase subunit NqrD
VINYKGNLEVFPDSKTMKEEKEKTEGLFLNMPSSSLGLGLMAWSMDWKGRLSWSMRWHAHP